MVLLQVNNNQRWLSKSQNNERGATSAFFLQCIVEQLVCLEPGKVELKLSLSALTLSLSVSPSFSLALALSLALCLSS